MHSRVLYVWPLLGIRKSNSRPAQSSYISFTYIPRTGPQVHFPGAHVHPFRSSYTVIFHIHMFILNFIVYPHIIQSLFRHSELKIPTQFIV